MGFQTSCPGCGAPIEFDVANSVVAVCGNCGSVVGRGDGKLEEYGRVADLVDTDSPLQVGLEGKVKGVPFEVTGRTQLKHAAGGIWDEWYVAFRDGERWGWLAEAQGRYYLTFKKKLPETNTIADLASVQVEDEVMIPGTGLMKVVEVGTATVASAEGEIPFAFRPGETYQYADLVGPGRKFATLDGSESPPTLYLGGEFSLEKLGISATAESREQAERSVAAVAVSCPQCGGSLELRAPDETMRVACPYCDSLLDASHGQLKFLTALLQQKFQPVIPLGSKGTLEGREYTVIGAMQRSITYQGREYPWQEYLLHTPREPFHWLISSNRHWSLGKPISPADVNAKFRNLQYKGKAFRLYDRGSPEVKAVYGEFYWKVAIGERVFSADYIRPPNMISREETASAEPPVAGEQQSAPDVREVNYTLNKYIEADEIKKAFQLKSLLMPTGVAPNQPYPHRGIYTTALFLLGFAFLAGALVWVTAKRHPVLTQSFTIAADAPGGGQIFSQIFEVKARRNVVVECSTSDSLVWAYLDGAFYNEETSKSYPFAVAVPAKKTGNRARKYLSALPKGKYTLKGHIRGPTAVLYQPRSPSGSMLQQRTLSLKNVKVTVYQDMPRLRYWLILLALLAVFPIAIAIHQMSFQYRRWEDSDYSPFATE